MKNHVEESLFFKKVKSTTKSADKYVQMLNNQVLPRCQTAEITSDIVQRLFSCIYIIYSSQSQTYIFDSMSGYLC